MIKNRLIEFKSNALLKKILQIKKKIFHKIIVQCGKKRTKKANKILLSRVLSRNLYPEYIYHKREVM